MLIDELQGESSAMLLDPHFALPGGMTLLSPAKGLIVTLEDSIFRETDGGRISAEIDDWSVEKIKRCGGDAVKVLAWYRPDASATVNAAQHDFVARIGDACARYDIPFVFELLVYPLPGEANQTTQYIEMADKKSELVLESVRAFADPRFGIDMFKLESPVPAQGRSGTRRTGRRRGAGAVRRDGPPRRAAVGHAVGRRGMQEFKAILGHAYKAGASGYLAGRAIWAKPFLQFPDWDEIQAGLRRDSMPYMKELNTLTDARAMPWFAHPRFGGAVDGTPSRRGFPPPLQGLRSIR